MSPRDEIRLSNRARVDRLICWLCVARLVNVTRWWRHGVVTMMSLRSEELENPARVIMSRKRIGASCYSFIRSNFMPESQIFPWTKKFVIRWRGGQSISWGTFGSRDRGADLMFVRVISRGEKPRGVTSCFLFSRSDRQEIGFVGRLNTIASLPFNKSPHQIGRLGQRFAAFGNHSVIDSCLSVLCSVSITSLSLSITASITYRSSNRF